MNESQKERFWRAVKEDDDLLPEQAIDYLLMHMTGNEIESAIVYMKADRSVEPTYNHAFCLPFTVPRHPSPEGDVKGSVLRQAIITRLENLSDEELVETCDAPVDSYEEDQ